MERPPVAEIGGQASEMERPPVAEIGGQASEMERPQVAEIGGQASEIERPQVELFLPIRLERQIEQERRPNISSLRIQIPNGSSVSFGVNVNMVVYPHVA
jgi:hypothetical protein